MIGENLLSSTIEVGIGIAGFSSIVVSLAKESVTPKIKLTFLQLWIQSAGIIFFSALPMMLNLILEDPRTIYVIASYMYGLYLCISMTIGPLPKRVKEHKILAIGFTFPIIVIVNALFFGLAWLYIAVIVAGVMFAFLSFYQLISAIWLAESTT